MFQSFHQRALRAYARTRIAIAKNGVRACMRELDSSQWLPAEHLEQMQVARLKDLLQHAEANCPFYRARFRAAGFSAAKFSRLADLQAVPPLTKREVQDHYEDMIATNLPRNEMGENHTGGSTGTPLKLYQSWDYRKWALADIWRNFTMCGFEPGMRRAFLWGSDFDAKYHKTFVQRAVYDRLRDNLYWINTFDIDETGLISAARRLERFRPHLLIGYVSSLTLFARVVRANGFAGIRPAAIQSSAEALTPSQRSLIEDTFKAKVFDRYGCREVGNIAHECDHHEGLHLLAECNFTEFLKDGDPVRPGEVGQITVTNLFNQAMPLIRYQLGDLGRPTDRRPACGRGLPLMEVVEGRTTDVITAPSGKLLHGEFFTHLFYKIDGIRQFQVIQETPEALNVKIEPMPTLDRTAAVRFLEDTIHQHGDPDFRVRFEFVDSIPVSSSGKFRFTMSRVPLHA